MFKRSRLNLNGKQVEAATDGEYCMVEDGGLIYSWRVGDRSSVRVEPAYDPADDESAVMAEKLRRVREHARRPVAPKSQRESYLHANYRKRIREAHDQGFRYGLEEAKAKLAAAPLSQRVTEADKDELVELVMGIVLGDKMLRQQFVAVAAMADDWESQPASCELADDEEFVG
jgi:hypothetical protein